MRATGQDQLRRLRLLRFIATKEEQRAFFYFFLLRRSSAACLQSRSICVKPRNHNFLEDIAGQWSDREWKQNFCLSRATFPFLCQYGTRSKKVNVLRAYYTYGYGRTTPTATGVLRLRLRAYDAYGYGRTSLRLRAYYAYGYGRIAATTTGVLQPQAYYGLATGCKLTSGHYNRER